MYQQQANPMQGQQAPVPSTRRPSLGDAGKRHSRRVGFWTHAISGLGWGLTTPVVWMISFTYIFMSIFGGFPLNDDDTSSLGAVRDEIAADFMNAPGFSTYFFAILLACAMFAIVSLVVGLIGFRRWGMGRAFGITALSAGILHIVIFPIFLMIGSVITGFVLAFNQVDSPFTSDLPVELVVITGIVGVLFALINGLLGMLLSWLFAHAFRPQRQLQW